MTDTTEAPVSMIDPVTGEIIVQKGLAEELLPEATEQGVSLGGETVLEAELTEHLVHEHGEVPIAEDMRNGARPKTVLVEIGPAGIGVPFGSGRVLRTGDRVPVER